MKLSTYHIEITDTFGGEVIDDAPIVYDGKTFILCEACYAYSYKVGGSNHGDAMRVIMAGINAGMTSGQLDDITWKVLPA